MGHQSLLTSKRVELMMGYHLLVLMVAGLASSHEYFPEKCPEFQPMQGFDWDQFSNGVWYVTQKFATRSTCLTYEFTTDELGFKEKVIGGGVGSSVREAVDQIANEFEFKTA